VSSTPSKFKYPRALSKASISAPTTKGEPLVKKSKTIVTTLYTICAYTIEDIGVLVVKGSSTKKVGVKEAIKRGSTSSYSYSYSSYKA
jgi:hypothetical protein